MDSDYRLELRMYGLVPYNISPIQQGIQFGHGVVEYICKYADDLQTKSDDPYSKYVCNQLSNWMAIDKTFIILNGGTTNWASDDVNEEGKRPFKGSLNRHAEWLLTNKIPYARFTEPDLGDQLTSVNFIVDERVFNKEKYPDFDLWLMERNGGHISRFITGNGKRTPLKDEYPNQFKEYEDFVGGPKNVLLRQWLKQFKLA